MPRKREVVGMNLRIPGDLYRRLVLVAADRKVEETEPWTYQEIFRVALDQWLKKQERKGGRR